VREKGKRKKRVVESQAPDRVEDQLKLLAGRAEKRERGG
jgi:hypothetical protein